MGGTQRLPRRVGLQAALDMILTGRTIRAKRALQMGLVDEMVHPAILREIAIDRARSARRRHAKSRTRRVDSARRVSCSSTIRSAASVVFKKARESVMEKTHGHYPAPLAALDAVHAGYTRGFEGGFARKRACSARWR